MTNYEVMRLASREQLATILAAMAMGLLGEDDAQTFKALRHEMLEYLDEDPEA